MKLSDLLGLFKEGKTTAKSHMKNLLEMAMVDSHFDDSEYELLQKLAKKYKVSEKQLSQIQKNPDNVEFELPDNEDEKFEQFYELVQMMMVDTKIFDEEKNLCKIFAKKFGYKGERDLVDAVAQNIKYGQPWDETKRRVTTLL